MTDLLGEEGRYGIIRLWATLSEQLAWETWAYAGQWLAAPIG